MVAINVMGGLESRGHYGVLVAGWGHGEPPHKLLLLIVVIVAMVVVGKASGVHGEKGWGCGRRWWMRGEVIPAGEVHERGVLVTRQNLSKARQTQLHAMMLEIEAGLEFAVLVGQIIDLT